MNPRLIQKGDAPSPVQLKVLAFIARFIAEKKYAPANREIGDELGGVSTFYVSQILDALTVKGLLEPRPKAVARALVLTELGRKQLEALKAKRPAEVSP